MRIALLGTDGLTLELVRQLPAPIALVAIYDDRPLAVGQAEFGALLRPAAAWTTILDRDQPDAVIVAGGRWSDARVEQVRQLLQAEMPLLIAWTECDPLLVYELDMIRQSSGGVLAAIAPRSVHPAARLLAELIRDADRPVGELEQLVIERLGRDRSRAQTLSQIAEDADLLRLILDRIQTVTASGVTAESTHWSSVGLQMTGLAGPPVRWNFTTAESGIAVRVSLLGSKGKWTWECSEQGQASRVTRTGAETLEWPAWNWQHSVLDMFSEALRGAPPQPNWPQVCQAMEVVDATERSVSRGRRIDLTGRTVTEKDTFRGVMSAGGCFLIIATLLVVIGFAVIEGFRMANLGPSSAMPSAIDPETGRTMGPTRPIPYWAIFLAVPMVSFLILQLLQLVIRKPRNDRKSAG